MSRMDGQIALMRYLGWKEAVIVGGVIWSTWHHPEKLMVAFELLGLQ